MAELICDIQDASPAAQALCQLMSDISEACYCAGWMHGLEEALWQIVKYGPEFYGIRGVTQEEINQLRFLSEQAGGWIYFEDNKGTYKGEHVGERFIPFTQWEARFKKYMSRGSLFDWLKGAVVDS